jgi:hypothetical protein
MNQRLPLAKRETPPGRNPAARTEPSCGGSGFDGVGTFAVLTLGRCDGQAHFLANRTGQEPADGMRLPTGGFHQFLGCDSAWPLEQFQNLVGLAAFAGSFGFLSAFGRFLGGAGLLGRLGCLLRDVGATLRTAGLLGGFRLLSACRGLRCTSFCDQFSHFDFSFGGDYRHDMDHSGAPEKQANCDTDRRRRRRGDEALAPGQMAADGS